MAPYCHPVTELCQNEQWDNVRDMIEKEPSLVWSFIDGGYTLVKFFCWYGRVDMLQFALKILTVYRNQQLFGRHSLISLVMVMIMRETTMFVRT